LTQDESTPNRDIPARAPSRRRLTQAVLGVVALSLVATGALVTHKTASVRPSSPAATKARGTTIKAPAASPGCVNTFDPSCGPFHWEPQPDSNEPMAITLTASAAQGVVGKAVDFTAGAIDPDATIACHWIFYGDEPAALAPALTINQRYGTWKPPAKHRGELHLAYSHTYAKPGTYHVQFGAGSGNSCRSNYNPYGEESAKAVTISILAAS
jgi:hypothetical protein